MADDMITEHSIDRITMIASLFNILACNQIPLTAKN